MTKAQLGLDADNNVIEGEGGAGLGNLEHVFRKVPVAEEEWVDDQGDALYFTRNNLYH